MSKRSRRTPRVLASRKKARMEAVERPLAEPAVEPPTPIGQGMQDLADPLVFVLPQHLSVIDGLCFALVNRSTWKALGQHVARRVNTWEDLCRLLTEVVAVNVP